MVLVRATIPSNRKLLVGNEPSRIRRTGGCFGRRPLQFALDDFEGFLELRIAAGQKILGRHLDFDIRRHTLVFDAPRAPKKQGLTPSHVPPSISTGKPRMLTNPGNEVNVVRALALSGQSVLS